MDMEAQLAFEVDNDTTCSVCSAEFLDAEDLKVHIAQVHLNATSIQRYCQFCSLIFSSLEDYVYHIRDNHLTYIKCCKYCTRAFTDFNLLRKHEAKHYTYVKKSMYSCSQCKEMFNSIFELERHEHKNHSNDNEGIMLHDCFPLLSAILNIKATTFLHSLGTNTIYKCIQCEFQSPEAGDYIIHLQERNCRAYSCDKCSNVYKEKKGLKKHIANHEECQNLIGEDLTKPCTKCLKQIDAQILAEHTKHCKPVSCTLCEIPFDTLKELQEHQGESHPLAITLTRCKFCHREFVGTNQLDKHIDRTHKGQLHLYKYACVYCEDTYFKHPKDLFGHLFSKHQDVQPYSCKICDKTFRIRKRFTIHIKLNHNSVGFVEFDERYHVFFTDKKSENPFQPKSLYTVADTSEQVEIDEEEMPETDTETHDKSKSKKKSLKVTFEREQETDKEGYANVCSDFMSATETEANQTDNDETSKSKLKRKSKTVYSKPSKIPKKEVFTTEAETEISDSEDEPLLVVKKREKIKRVSKFRFAAGNKIKKRSVKDNKKRFTCNICKKYCYTYQNYHHHVSMHFRNEVKKCIKCSKEFKSKTELNKHVATEHATSKLTETLKNLLERRKNGTSAPQLTAAEKFQRTIKRVPVDNTEAKVTLSKVSNKLSVKNFIESFTPEISETTKKPVEVDTVVSVKTCYFATRKPPVVKMTKFEPKPQSIKNTKLAMPVKFRPLNEKQKVTIKLIQKPTIETVEYENSDNGHDDNHDNNEDSYVGYEETVDYDKNDVPEMAEEIMLEETADPKPQVVPHKIIIPKLPKEYNRSKIRIAHLLPEAPFYKIVTIDEVVNPKTDASIQPQEDLKLPDGTKLVNVNPLAHLLGDTPVEQILPSKNKKYYKPRTENFENAIAKALLKLEKPTAPRKKKKKSAPEPKESNPEEINNEV